MCLIRNQEIPQKDQRLDLSLIKHIRMIIKLNLRRKKRNKPDMYVRQSNNKEINKNKLFFHKIITKKKK